MTGSIPEAVFVLGEFERDMATARRWLKEHADDLVEAGVVSISFNTARIKGEGSILDVGNTVIELRLQTMSREALGRVARVLAEGAGFGRVAKSLGSSEKSPEPRLLREFGRVRTIVWAPVHRVCEPVDFFPWWNCERFERGLLAGAGS